MRCNDMLDVERVDRHLERGVIEIAPIAFIAGPHLERFILSFSMKRRTQTRNREMFLTRIGYNSKAVINR